MDLAGCYTAVAADWDRSAGPVYGALAEELVGCCPVRLDGAHVLDVGAGGGAIAAVASSAGASVVTADRVVAMGPDSVGDVLHLPFRSRSFAVAAAGFVLNHVEPRAALREMGRVAATVLVSTWAAGADPLKIQLDSIQRARGWSPPEWFVRMKAEVEPVSGYPDRLASAADAAGLSEVRVEVRRVAHDWTAEEIVAYRWSMPHIGPWIQALSRVERIDLWDEMLSAVEPCAADWSPAVILLSAASDGQAQPTNPPAARSSAAAQGPA